MYFKIDTCFTFIAEKTISDCPMTLHLWLDDPIWELLKKSCHIKVWFKTNQVYILSFLQVLWSTLRILLFYFTFSTDFWFLYGIYPEQNVHNYQFVYLSTYLSSTLVNFSFSSLNFQITWNINIIKTHVLEILSGILEPHRSVEKWLFLKAKITFI